MKGLVIVLALVVGNLLGHFFWTKPMLEERETFETLRRELEESSVEQSAVLVKWRRLEELLELAETSLEPIHSRGDSSEFALLRDAFLEAERGLPLERGELYLRPVPRVPEGFHGVRVHVTAMGDFDSLLRYLNRVSLLKAPIAPVEISLVEKPTEYAPLLLSATWLAIWPEETSS